MKRKVLSGLCALCLLVFAACTGDGKSPDSPVTPDSPTSVTQSVTIQADELLTIGTAFSVPSATVHNWTVTSAASDAYSLQNAATATVSFLPLNAGSYVVTDTFVYDGDTYTQTMNVTVTSPATAFSAYIDTVFDYQPAPGQFVNMLPKYTEGMTKADILALCNTALVGQEKGSLIHLGGFGGYIDFGFDHTIPNVSGYRDFRIMGNAFWATDNPSSSASSRGGSCEPGVIMVAYDANGNGRPDDNEWYEIAGSEYDNSETIHNYVMTYYRPETETADEKKSGHVIIKNYIYWTDNQGNSGYLPKNQYHTQSYYPLWESADKLTFTGTLLPNNAVDESGAGTYYVQYSFDYGYADNAPNDDDESAIDIDWAVDANGQKVHLPGIDFVRVYCGMNQDCGWLGETSTEIMGAVSLHVAGTRIATRQ